MPTLTDSSSLLKMPVTGSRYGFSGTRLDRLGSAEYTLVTIAADVSGSVHGFIRAIETCISEIVTAAARSSRADSLMLRVVAFDDKLKEIHGFKPLMECAPDGYRHALSAGGTTALYDAAHNAVGAMTGYGDQLTSHDFDVNALLFVITDGADNASVQTARGVGQALREAVTGEKVESLLSVLVGVNVMHQTSRFLMDFSAGAGFDQYVELKKADAATLGRLADFASRSIAVQSSALGTAAPSQPLSF